MKLLLLLLLLVPAQAFASSADSGRCPWKLPFTIKIHAVGTNTQSHTYNEPHGGSSDYYSPTLDSQDFEFTVDTSMLTTIAQNNPGASMLYALNRDTLRYSYSYTTNSGSSSTGESASAVIIFVPGADSIRSISLQQSGTSSYGIESNGNHFSFQISSLAFDPTSIFCTNFDSSHNAAFSSRTSSGGNQWPNFSWLGNYTYTDFTAASISISGIIRPTSLVIDSTVRPCPWKLPFELVIHSEGLKDTAGQQISSSFDTTYTVADALIVNNVLQFGYSHEESEDYGLHLHSNAGLQIYFVEGKDSISSISLMEEADTANQYDSVFYSFGFRMLSVAYDTSSVFTTDSSFCGHSMYLNYTDLKKTFTATSAALSGIFRPTHYTCAESVSEPKAQSEALTVASSNHALECSFSASSVLRRLDVYSILGTRVTSVPILPGNSSANVFGLSPGFYFVLLGNAVAKAIVAD